MFRRVLVAAVVLLALLAGATSRASSTTISPCKRVSQPTWSPDGQQIAYYGTRWPAPHRMSLNILQALCTMNADGTNAQPVRYTVCSEHCPDPPYPNVWLQSGILFMRGGDIFRIVPGSKPQGLARADTIGFVTNPTGTRIASQKYYDSCVTCAAPVTTFDAQSGAVVGRAGGTKFDNADPSLSPDGTKVAFARYSSHGPSKAYGVWTASTNGSHLRQLEKVGRQPLWSSTGGEIAYVVPAKSGWPVTLRVVSAGGGKSRALLRDVATVFGWSPDGKSIAFETSKDKLAVVDVATRKVHSLLQLHFAPTAVWSPDSSELLVNTVPKTQKCWSTWRVPANGSAPTKISSCTG